MNGAQVTAASSVGGNLATLLVWISNGLAHGVWFPVDSGTAIAAAALITAAVGASGVSVWNARRIAKLEAEK